ncbi:hypothetical protein GOV09_06680 [Candidatus Woesearchaeota archaeon]|nr:hypothetical protein [Candidatus Woesearchaeota archaeon]
MGRFIYEISLIAVLVFIVVIFATTGVQKDEGGERIDGVYEYLSFVKNHPQQFMVVVGAHALDHERVYGEKIAGFLGTRIKRADSVESRQHLILVGNPSTNLLLDKLITSYPKGSSLHVRGNNLFIFLNDEQEAQVLSEVIENFVGERNQLSPSTVRVGLEKILNVLGVIIVLIPLFIFLFERLRKRPLHEDREDDERYKMQVLMRYIKKYEEEGHSEEQIKEWLMKFDYQEELINRSLDELHAIQKE